ncbi:hypothetical protein [Rhizobium sp. MHM7A]|uniref:hypothetical protein n=1 Tax=Rhizobium sp. MHM7A TaxID=2583233 RepID=UPI001106CF43|nr:hypothetical protein [Rhizobium sp. MHM7A]TLX16367.1 hypothetical protein FFR93_03275 [Rhizobium sp. MHM7A]
MFDDVLFGWDGKRSRAVENAYLAGAAFAEGSVSFTLIHAALFEEMRREIADVGVVARQVPSIVELKEAYAAGYIDHLDHDEDDNRLKYLMRDVDETAVSTMSQASASLHELSFYGLDSAEIMEAVLRQLMIMRDAAVETARLRKRGLFSWFSRKKKARHLRELGCNYLHAVPDADLSHAMALAALEFCRKSKETSPDEASDWIIAADYLRTASINVCHIDRAETLAALEKVEQVADDFNEQQASLV